MSGKGSKCIIDLVIKLVLLSNGNGCVVVATNVVVVLIRVSSASCSSCVGSHHMYPFLSFILLLLQLLLLTLNQGFRFEFLKSRIIDYQKYFHLFFVGKPTLSVLYYDICALSKIVFNILNFISPKKNKHFKKVTKTWRQKFHYVESRIPFDIPTSIHVQAVKHSICGVSRENKLKNEGKSLTAFGYF